MRQLSDAERAELQKKVVEYHQQRAEQVARNVSQEGGRGDFFGPEKAGIRKGVSGGLAMMAIAVIWFVVGWSIGLIFFYPPILFLIGVYAFLKGIITGNFSGEVEDSSRLEKTEANPTTQQRGEWTSGEKVERSMKPLIILLGVFLTLFASATPAADEVRLYLHMGIESDNFLSEIDLPDGVDLEVTLFAGGTYRWETFLTGDLAPTNNVYSFSLDLAAATRSTFQAELITVNQAAVQNVIAKTDFVVESPVFKRFNAVVKGNAPKTQAGDRLILKLTLKTGGPGAVLFGRRDVWDSSITIPQPTPNGLPFAPRDGRWEGRGAAGERVSFLLSPKNVIRNFQIEDAQIECDLRNGHHFFNEMVEGEISVKAGVFRVPIGDEAFFIGVFTDQKEMVGIFTYTVNEGGDRFGLCSKQTLVLGDFEALAVSPSQVARLTTWGALKHQ